MLLALEGQSGSLWRRIILVPVELNRGTAGEKFRLKARAEDVASNLSLEAYLDRVHKLRMPAFEASDSLDIEAYFADVAKTVADKEGWEVLPDEMTVGFFSFAKFLMYRDLDPAVWPAGNTLLQRPLVKGLLSDGFPGGEGMLDENANIDPVIPPVDMLHILDCDSSQAIAIHEVRRGRDMVTFDVKNVLKGELGPSVRLVSVDSIHEMSPRCCVVGHTYLVIGKRTQTGDLLRSVDGPYGVFDVSAEVGKASSLNWPGSTSDSRKD